MMKKIMLILTAAIGLTMSAHARLGWTLDDCQNLWGAPAHVEYDSSINQTCYTFRSQANLFVQVYLLNGLVQSIGYSSKDKTFLRDNADQLLQKNFSGAWTLYDDGRGKESLYSWQVRNNEGQMIAYAIFWNHPDAHGFYKLTMATSLWQAFLTNNNVNQSVNSNGLNT